MENPRQALDEFRGNTVENPYQAPTAAVDDVSTGENNSGGGSSIVPPVGVKGWSWGAFLLNWIWALGNKTWIGVLAIIPYIGFIVAIYLGVKGRELAWRNKRWDSFEHFDAVQKKWSWWAVVLVFGVMGVGIFAAIMIPMFAGSRA